MTKMYYLLNERSLKVTRNFVEFSLFPISLKTSPKVSLKVQPQPAQPSDIPDEFQSQTISSNETKKPEETCNKS